jgi:hypothetical protein
MVEIKQKIVSRHWTRENARRSQHRVQRWLNVVNSDQPPFNALRHAQLELDDRGVPRWAVQARVERAGRIRARWVVVVRES